MTAAAVLALSGCEDGKNPFAAKSATGGGNVLAPNEQLALNGEAEQEAPGVFKYEGEGLWDGRPSLGGVWVAHASVKDPERVMIRNTKNGKSVVGALFRRERNNPGPALQVSSDAAEDLGLLAGAPTELSVVALRKVEAPAPAETTAADAAMAAGATAQVEPMAGETAGDGAIPSGAADATVVEAMPDETAAPAPKKGFLARLFGKKKPDPAMSVTTDEPVAADGIAAAPIEQTSLDQVQSTAAAGIAAAEAGKAPAAPATALKRPYVQIGIFSVEANAKRAAGQMEAKGLRASVVADESQGKSFWRVIVGPAENGDALAALQAQIRNAGYPDAYPVSK
ncbi:MAG: SPOR domain-containing protein [Defluviimonas sp.]|uniref:SPOR domain-containing protein n=1 Tax=Albidovulum sp. TaxID=1872424 RepID=UPI001DA11474|nr:SPOR domain-containing protein [Paracoccaceae bacterium]MCC0063052.1 SPOR domain-containing protein [Defluviimonas sp.]